jgi:hypothetical protein
MRAAVLAWVFFRCLRWLFWLGAVAYYIEFFMHRPDHLNQFGHLCLLPSFGCLAFHWQQFLRASLS